MQQADYVIRQTGLSGIAVENTLQLLAADCSIPFIARYRKERTTGLDEVAIAQIQKAAKAFEDLNQRKQTVLKAIESLDDELRERIEAAGDLQTVEDLYLPFKKKRKTKATEARDQGLEPLAKIILSGNFNTLEDAAHRFTKSAGLSIDQALQGARYIMAEWFAERLSFRNQLRRSLSKGQLHAKLIKKEAESEKAATYKDYFDWNESVSRMASHRVLAIFRGQREGILRVGIQIDSSAFVEMMCDRLIRGNDQAAFQIELAAQDAYKRLLFPSIEREVLQLLKEKADDIAIRVFATNLEQLLLAPPLGEKRILALDPGFRTGCKLVCLDQRGNLLHNETIFITGSAVQKSQSKLATLVNAYKIEAIGIGNGTASRETQQMVEGAYLKGNPETFIVNEAGASIYSASKIAREEFPDYDITVRGAISIGRRLADPLAELVKIDPKSIGVGQYQHDVDQKKLQEELERVVASCVNKVGVNINTASKSLLEHVSGIGPKLAENIIAYRKEIGGFQSREEIKKVPRLGGKAYEQAAAFLRVKNAKLALDDSAVHPESYYLVKKMAKSLEVDLNTLIGSESLIEQLSPSDFVDDKAGLPTVEDILKELKKPGLDPRKKAKAFKFDASIKDIKDLKKGMRLPGKVNNITNFGCFVDIGIKQSGLVHVSRLSKSFVRDINEIVKLGDQVEVEIIEVDLQRKRIQLAMDYD